MIRTAVTISITLICGWFVSVFFACSQDSEERRLGDALHIYIFEPSIQCGQKGRS